MCTLNEEEIVEGIKFHVIGIITSKEFQRSRCYAERLYRNVPKIYLRPDIRPVLDVEWGEFQNKVRRNVGGRSWETNKEVAVFVNTNYIGDDDDFIAYISRTFAFRIIEDWTKHGQDQLIKIIEQNQSNNKEYVYLTIAVNNKVIGPLLFLLHSDMVPRTSHNFIRLCKSKQGGYMGSPIHRIVKGGWIQGGGFSISKRKIPSENFIVRHNRRGILSMANGGWHKNNSTQFIISLEATPWMDCKYVAFGQLVQGEEVLKIIENINTSYEKPTENLRIVASGEFSLYPRIDEQALIELNKYIETRDLVTMAHEDVTHPKDIDSSMVICAKLLKHCYALETDMRSYLPFIHLPSYLIFKYLYEKVSAPGEEEEEEEGGYEELKKLWMLPSFATLDSAADFPSSETESLRSHILKYVEQLVVYGEGGHQVDVNAIKLIVEGGEGVKEGEDKGKQQPEAEEEAQFTQEVPTEKDVEENPNEEEEELNN